MQRRRGILPVAVAVLLSCSHGNTCAKRLLLGPGIPGGPLTPEECKLLDTLQVCSKRAAAMELNNEEGTLAAFNALWDEGLRCFDMDFVASKDNFLISTHPGRLRWALEEAAADEIYFHPEAYNLRHLRSLGATAAAFPILEQTMREMMKRARNLTQAETAELDDSLRFAFKPSYAVRYPRLIPTADNRRRPTIFVDLKHSEYSREILKKIQNAANKYSVVNVVLVIKGRSDADAVQQAAFYMGPLMRGIDHEETLPNGKVVASSVKLQEEDLSLFQSLAPSLELGDDVLEVARRSGKPLYGWPVEAREDLRKALTLGMTGISTSVPIGIKQLMREWKQGACSGSAS